VVKPILGPCGFVRCAALRGASSRQVLKCFEPVLLAFVLFGAPAGWTQQVKCPPAVTGMAVQRGQIFPLPGAVFTLQDFAATMHQRGNTVPYCLVFFTDIRSGRASISPESLSKIASEKVQEDSKTQVKDLNIEVQGNSLRLKGKVHKAIDIDFEIEGPISTDGRVMIFHAKQIKAKGIPVKELLNAVGLHLSSLVYSQQEKGVEAKDDNLIFDPWKIAYIRATITSVQLAPNGLTVNFRSATATEQKR
jgi:hypothetical protein